MSRFEKPQLPTYLVRALRLRCPVCGVTPLFKPLREVRSVGDWIHPHDRCERCGLRYEREPGYFLVAIWGINYMVVALSGIAIWMALEYAFDLSLTRMFLSTTIPMVVLSMLTIRRSKALFLAFDRFVDPD